MSKATEAKDLQLTSDEAKQLEDAFQDETFRKLFSDYVSELSDPKHREEQEAYIRQLEEQNELPEGKILIRPKKGFVIKFQKKSRSNENCKSKLFLNMVYSEEVSKPTSSEGSSSATESLAAGGGGGMKWSIPFALGPLRLEADKTGDLVPTFDCCFHPLSLQYAHGSKSFREMIIGIAKDAIQTSFEASGDETELADGYTILKGVSYKNGSQPKSMMVTKHDTTREQNQSKSPKGDSNTASPQNSNTKNANLTPEYKIVERGNFEIADHTTMTTKTISRRPKDLIVYVHLEQVNSVADIALDVSERSLALKSIKATKHHYNLEVVLPYPVNSDDGHAKFDKRQKQLIVTLPVIEA